MQTSTSLTSGIKEPKLPQWFQTWFGSEPKNTNKQRKRYEPRNTGQLLFLKTNCVAEFSCRDPGLTMYWPRLRSPAVSLGSSLMTLNSEPLLWLNAGAALRRFTEQLQEEEEKKKKRFLSTAEKQQAAFAQQPIQRAIMFFPPKNIVSEDVQCPHTGSSHWMQLGL